MLYRTSPHRTPCGRSGASCVARHLEILDRPDTLPSRLDSVKSSPKVPSILEYPIDRRPTRRAGDPVYAADQPGMSDKMIDSRLSREDRYLEPQEGRRLYPQWLSPRRLHFRYPERSECPTKSNLRQASCQASQRKRLL